MNELALFATTTCSGGARIHPDGASVPDRGSGSVAARRGVRMGQLPPGARGRGRQKRVVAAKEGGDKYDIYDIFPRAPETLEPPLRTNTPYWGPKTAKLNVLGPILSKNAVNNAPIRMKGPNEYLLLLW